MSSMSIFVFCFVIVGAVLGSDDRSLCPPMLPISVCDQRCGAETVCDAPNICCPTNCGGTVCVNPVAKRHFINHEKEGVCSQPAGPWTCKSTCSTDLHCQSDRKCCPNHCGAFVCVEPHAEG